MPITPVVPEDLNEIVTIVELCESELDGTVAVTVSIIVDMSADQRGAFLLDLEDLFCALDPRVRVWHKALGDKNSLRNLRGITVL